MRISDWSSDVCSSDLRLHIIVDTASRHTAEERERPGMGIEQHLLALARIGPDIGCARVAETHMRHLHPHRLAGDLHILVAPVELVGLTRLEGHRDERRCAFASILPPRSTPARRIAAHRSEEHTSELQSLMRISYAVF